MRSPPHFRAFGRRWIELPVVIRARTKAWEEAAQMLDLGLGGACLELAEHLEPSAGVTLEVRTPTLWDPLVLHGEVAWARRDEPTGKTRVGVRFQHRDPSSLYALFEFLGAQVFDV
jgi:hypothetical protein